MPAKKPPLNKMRKRLGARVRLAGMRRTKRLNTRLLAADGKLSNATRYLHDAHHALKESTSYDDHRILQSQYDDLFAHQLKTQSKVRKLKSTIKTTQNRSRRIARVIAGRNKK